jgi:hypothetical protein
MGIAENEDILATCTLQQARKNPGRTGANEEPAAALDFTMLRFRQGANAPFDYLR